MEGLRRTPDLATGHPDLQGLIPDPEHVEWRVLQLMDAIDAAPENDRPILVLGYLQFLKGDYEGAKLALQAVSALDPENEASRRLLEFIYRVENEDEV
jgi:cytochrome c-type biogenesis protein CcmH/NrfG